MNIEKLKTRERTLEDEVLHLRKEIQILTCSAEDIHLLENISSNINLAPTPEEVISIAIEGIGLYKDLAYCAFLSVSDTSAKITYDFGPRLLQSCQGEVFLLEKTFKNILNKKEYVHKIPAGKPLPEFIPQFRDETIPNSFYISPVTVNEKIIGMILCVNSFDDSTYLIQLFLLLDRICNVIKTRLETLYLMADLALVNERLMYEINERKQAEKKLNEAIKDAEDANNIKSKFLANMSHEIRTPMNGVLDMAELLLDTELTDSQRGHLDMLKISAENLMSIINDILDISKIESKKLAFEYIDFSLRRIIKDTLKTLVLSAQGKGLDLSYNVSPDIPDIVVGDPGRLRQVLINLLSNAIKFTEIGDVIISTELVSRTQNEVFLHFAVSDTGIGIPDDEKENIFNAFTRADNSTTQKNRGTGMGLSISSSLVELMKGKMWVKSEAGQGSTFHFTARFDIIP